MEIYIEDFILLNLCANLLSLLLCTRFQNRRPNRHTLFATLLSTLWAIIAALIPTLAPWLQPLVALLITRVAFPLPKGWRHRLRTSALLYATSFILGGAVLAAANAWGAVQNHLGWHLNIPFWMIPAGCMIGVITAVAITWTRATQPSNRRVHIALRIGSWRIETQALVDTGNQLYEPISGLPVAVMGLSAADFLPLEWREAIRRNAYENLEHAAQLRWIPYSSVGGTGVLPALPATVESTQQELLLAFSTRELAETLIVPAQLFDT